MARAHLILKGLNLAFGSLNEALAINAFARQRNIDFLSPLFAVVDPKSAEKASKQLREVMFPEEEANDAAYTQKAQEMLEKLRDVNLVAHAGNDNGDTGYVKSGQILTGG